MEIGEGRKKKAPGPPPGPPPDLSDSEEEYDPATGTMILQKDALAIYRLFLLMKKKKF